MPEQDQPYGFRSALTHDVPTALIRVEPRMKESFL